MVGATVGDDDLPDVGRAGFHVTTLGIGAAISALAVLLAGIYYLSSRPPFECPADHRMIGSDVSRRRWTAIRSDFVPTVGRSSIRLG